MTEKVDVFAFGVVVLETLAGRPNFDNTLEEDKIYILEWVSSVSTLDFRPDSDIVLQSGFCTVGMIFSKIYSMNELSCHHKSLCFVT